MNPEIPTKEVMEKRSLATQIELTKMALRPESEVYVGLCEITTLIDMFYNYLEKEMDKKMAKVTKAMKTAERDIKKGKAKEAVKVLKGAEKKNVKLTKIDREVRDPMIEKYKSAAKKVTKHLKKDEKDFKKQIKEDKQLKKVLKKS